MKQKKYIFVIITLIILLAVIITGCDYGVVYDLEITGKPTSPRQIITHDPPYDIWEEYANFDIQLDITENEDLYWVECFPYEGTYEHGYITNGEYNRPYNGTANVGALFTYACTITKWVARIRKNSTGPGSEILYEEIFAHEVIWEP